MGFIAKLLGRPAKAAIVHRRSRLAVLTQQTRMELLAMAVRDTLKIHGMPPDAILADAGNSQGRPDGVQLLLIFREWGPAHFPDLVSIEQTVLSRLSRIDSLSSTWLAGVSWRLQPVQSSQRSQLPTSGHCVPQRTAHRERSDAHVQAVFGHGDAAFARRSKAGEDFSPTLPMATERQPVQPAA